MLVAAVFVAGFGGVAAPTREFSYRILKGYAKDVAHSDWWEFCDLFWEVFTTPSESE